MNFKLIILLVLILNISDIFSTKTTNSDMLLKEMNNIQLAGNNDFQSFLKDVLNQLKIKSISHTQEKRGHIWKRMVQSSQA
jgi:hypothetical protein